MTQHQTTSTFKKMESNIRDPATSNVVPATVASSAAVVSWMVSRTALRWGARRLAGVFMGGAVVGVLTAGYLIYKASSVDTTYMHVMNEDEEAEEEQATTCDVCRHRNSEPGLGLAVLVCDGAKPHSFCSACFNRFVSYGLATEPLGFIFHAEENPNGLVRRPGEIPCPFFGEGCTCHSISALSLSLCLTPENQSAYRQALSLIRPVENGGNDLEENIQASLRQRRGRAQRTTLYQ